eukprot:TRINITY_DN84846_c0_g1_i1.p1 TRINITY_DN84846_c0_g1~~TRINITY_DN84846_c0_g1_i1.p1  ORF type:complete len:295 (+),score=33.56 TRINITY_DN84846_c0_g1_i1:317-1201(+)
MASQPLDRSLVEQGVTEAEQQSAPDEIVAAGHFSLGRLTDQSIKNLEKAVQLDSRQPLYLLTLAHSLWAQNKERTKAKKCFTQALAQLARSENTNEVDQRNNTTLKAEGFLHLGLLLLEGFGDRKEAKSAFQLSLQCNSNSSAPMANYQLGCILDKQGDKKGATEHYREALAKQPTMTAARLAYARLLARSPNESLRKEGLKEAMMAVKHAPGDAKAWLSCGILFADQDRIVEAKKIFEKLVALDPSYAKQHRVASILSAEFEPDSDDEVEIDVTKIEKEEAPTCSQTNPLSLL